MSQGFWFLRHGQTEYNARGLRCGGDLDVPLTAAGEAAIRALAPRLIELKPGLILTSPLQRTLKSAHIISEALGGIPIDIQNAFTERRLGAWNGLPISDTEALLRNQHTPPEGETNQDFVSRVSAGLVYLRQHADQRVLLIASKGIARVLSEKLGDPTRRTPDNGELIEYPLD